jgi:hypothetical protein
VALGLISLLGVVLFVPHQQLDSSCLSQSSAQAIQARLLRVLGLYHFFPGSPAFALSRSLGRECRRKAILDLTIYPEMHPK